MWIVTGEWKCHTLIVNKRRRKMELQIVGYVMGVTFMCISVGLGLTVIAALVLDAFMG
jgi:ERCC4-related helicase